MKTLKSDIFYAMNEINDKYILEAAQYLVQKKEKDISLHGIGLSNVKREVEKYMGDLDIKVKKNEFSVTILLQERRTENEY